jgi:3-oxoacyl-[acyl-carrier-protein] synthase III
VIFVAPAGAPPIGITGLGAYVPERALTSAEVAEPLGLDSEWILARTGIAERRIAAPAQAASDLAIPAAHAALERSGAPAASVDLVLVATSTPDMLAPATACLVAHGLGATPAAAYDLSAASTGFLYGLAQAYAAISSGMARRVLLIGVEVLSRFVDWRDRDTCILFGDGAAAVVVEPVRSGGIRGFELGADGSGATDIHVPGGGSRAPVGGAAHTIQMNGANVFRFSTRATAASVRQLLGACEADLSDVDLYVPHQSNRRMILHSARELGLAEERIVLDLGRHGNTASASIPLALARAREDGRLRPGTTVLLSAVGAGLTWGSALLTWDETAAA